MLDQRLQIITPVDKNTEKTKFEAECNEGKEKKVFEIEIQLRSAAVDEIYIEKKEKK